MGDMSGFTARIRVGAVVTGLIAASAVWAAAPASARLPDECTRDGRTVTCVFDTPGTAYTRGGVLFTLPFLVTTVHILAVGGRGGESCCHVVAPGGRAAVASGSVLVPPGATLFVDVGENGDDPVPANATMRGGGAGGGAWSGEVVDGRYDARPHFEHPYVHGGRGGGASSVAVAVNGADIEAYGVAPLVSAGGGGGGAATWSGILSPGGDAGAPGAGPRGGGAGPNAWQPAGLNPFAAGIAPGGAAGPPDIIEPGTTHTCAAGCSKPGWGTRGGAGGLVIAPGQVIPWEGTLFAPEGAAHGAGGGGGGGGWYGGGGGSAGGRFNPLVDPADGGVPPGGGGGGSSVIPAGGALVLAAPDSAPRVVLTFDVPA